MCLELLETTLGVKYIIVFCVVKLSILMGYACTTGTDAVVNVLKQIVCSYKSFILVYSGRSTAPPPPAITGPMKPDPQQGWVNLLKDCIYGGIGNYQHNLLNGQLGLLVYQ